jgi:phage terminase large subunit-like protein
VRPSDPVSVYARHVVAGKMLAGRPVRLACERHLRDVKEQKRRGLEWRPATAQRVIQFFEDMLTLEDGRPFILEPFQQFIVGSVFGWYGVDGYRRFRTAYVEIGKGNGKTPMAAGIGVYGLVADGEAAAEVYSAATAQDQAAICFKDAVGFVERSPELRDLVERQVGSLTVPGTRSVFRALSAEHKGLDGKRVHIGIPDELHEHPNGMVVDKLRAGTKSRRNALIFEITNSGFDRTSVCWNHHKLSLEVLEGVIENDSWFAYVCALDEGDSWQDENVWPKANPGIDKIIPRKYLRELVTEAQGMPSKENIVRRLNFCEWTEQSERAISMDVWNQGAAAFEESELRGRPCYGGLKISTVSDLSAFVLVFPPEGEESTKVLAWYWAPEDDVRARAQAGIPYDVWAKTGYLEVTPGNSTDAGRIAQKVAELASVYQIRSVAINNNYAGEALSLREQFGEEWLVSIGQTFLTMNAPVEEMYRLLKGGQLQHRAHPILRWNASNLAVKTNAAGNVMPDQERSADRTPGIVGIVAMLNALDRTLRQEPPSDGPSVYEERGALIF